MRLVVCTVLIVWLLAGCVMGGHINPFDLITVPEMFYRAVPPSDDGYQIDLILDDFGSRC